MPRMLQWGRVLEDAETCPKVMREYLEREGLQWGRVLEDAETLASIARTFN